MNDMEIRTIIVEDEPHIRELIFKKLTDLCPFIKVIALASEVDSAILEIEKNKPDLIFMDIKLKNRNSFEILDKIKTLNSEIIFLTAYNDYMLKAIKCSAIDYLLKPLHSKRLLEAVEKARIRIKEKKENTRLKYLIENIKNPLNKENKIGVPTMDGYEFIRIKDIIRCEADRNYTKIFLLNSKHPEILSSYHLKEFENLLSENDFCRVHKSHLINLMHMTRFSKSEGNVIFMSDDSHIPLSRTKKDIFLGKIRTI